LGPKARAVLIGKWASVIIITASKLLFIIYIIHVLALYCESLNIIFISI
jgi:hypothetical protein